MDMTVQVRYRYRLRVNSSQVAQLQPVFDACRFVWNQALGRWRDLWRQERISLSYGAADKELTDWRSRFDWLSEQPSVPQQQVLRDLYQAITAFLDQTNPAGRPDFKRKGKHSTYRDPAGRWWASFVVRVTLPLRPAERTDRATGLDLGLDTFATTCAAESDVPNPRLSCARAHALARSHRSSARKQRDSANRGKAQRRVARIEAKTAAQRADFQHKAARGLVCTFDRIGVEDLAVKHLSRRGAGRHKAGLNRSIADAGWAGFLRVLVWQAAKAGKQIVVLPACNTTQECSACGAKAKPRLELFDRIFRCWSCGLVLDRDRNSAWNLHPDHPRNNRLGCTGAGDDGDKTLVPAGTRAT